MQMQQWAAAMFYPQVALKMSATEVERAGGVVVTKKAQLTTTYFYR